MEAFMRHIYIFIYSFIHSYSGPGVTEQNLTQNGNRTEISTTGTIESLAMRYKHTEWFRFLVLIVKNQRLHVVKTQQCVLPFRQFALSSMLL